MSFSAIVLFGARVAQALTAAMGASDSTSLSRGFLTTGSENGGAVALGCHKQGASPSAAKATEEEGEVAATSSKNAAG